MENITSPGVSANAQNALQTQTLTNESQPTLTEQGIPLLGIGTVVGIESVALVIGQLANVGAYMFSNSQHGWLQSSYGGQLASGPTTGPSGTLRTETQSRQVDTFDSQFAASIDNIVAVAVFNGQLDSQVGVQYRAARTAILDFLYNNDLYILVKLNKINEEIAKQALAQRQAAAQTKQIELDNAATDLFERNRTTEILKGFKSGTPSEESFDFIDQPGPQIVISDIIKFPKNTRTKQQNEEHKHDENLVMVDKSKPLKIQTVSISGNVINGSGGQFGIAPIGIAGIMSITANFNNKQMGFIVDKIKQGEDDAEFIYGRIVKYICREMDKKSEADFSSILVYQRILEYSQMFMIEVYTPYYDQQINMNNNGPLTILTPTKNKGSYTAWNFYDTTYETRHGLPFRNFNSDAIVVSVPTAIILPFFYGNLVGGNFINAFHNVKTYFQFVNQGVYVLSCVLNAPLELIVTTLVQNRSVTSGVLAFGPGFYSLTIRSSWLKQITGVQDQRFSMYAIYFKLFQYLAVATADLNTSFKNMYPRLISIDSAFQLLDSMAPPKYPLYVYYVTDAQLSTWSGAASVEFLKCEQMIQTGNAIIYDGDTMVNMMKLLGSMPFPNTEYTWTVARWKEWLPGLVNWEQTDMTSQPGITLYPFIQKYRVSGYTEVLIILPKNSGANFDANNNLILWQPQLNPNILATPFLDPPLDIATDMSIFYLQNYTHIPDYAAKMAEQTFTTGDLSDAFKNVHQLKKSQINYQFVQSPGGAFNAATNPVKFVTGVELAFFELNNTEDSITVGQYQIDTVDFQSLLLGRFLNTFSYKRDLNGVTREYEVMTFSMPAQNLMIYELVKTGLIVLQEREIVTTGNISTLLECAKTAATFEPLCQWQQMNIDKIFNESDITAQVKFPQNMFSDWLQYDLNGSDTEKMLQQSCVQCLNAVQLNDGANEIMFLNNPVRLVSNPDIPIFSTHAFYWIISAKMCAFIRDISIGCQIPNFYGVPSIQLVPPLIYNTHQTSALVNGVSRKGLQASIQLVNLQTQDAYTILGANETTSLLYERRKQEQQLTSITALSKLAGRLWYQNGQTMELIQRATYAVASIFDTTNFGTTLATTSPWIRLSVQMQLNEKPVLPYDSQLWYIWLQNNDQTVYSTNDLSKCGFNTIISSQRTQANNLLTKTNVRNVQATALTMARIQQKGSGRPGFQSKPG